MSRILITGAARGIGAGTATALAQRGHDLALLGLEGELLEQVAAKAAATPRPTRST
jgi:NAD(P)-dependent dehydrogenase (short-subunit alcohol dehydrogenase family)